MRSRPAGMSRPVRAIRSSWARRGSQNPHRLSSPGRHRLVDVGGATASNDEVTGFSRDADADVVTAGREPSAHHGRPGRLLRPLVIVETAALITAIAVALHYRAEAVRPGHGGLPATGQGASVLPEMTSVVVRLPARKPVAGTVFITAARPGGDRGQFMVSAVISGGQPNTVYDLVGNDCSAVTPLPDHIWATGLTDAAGAARLRGYAWTGAVADEYWLALSPSPVYGSPGLRGRFARGSAAPFPAGKAPCAPSP